MSCQSEASRRRPAMGYVTRDAIRHYRQMHPGVSDANAASLVADPDVTKQLFFWQLFSVLGENRIVKIVQNLYARIAADDEEAWLPRAFTEIATWKRHVATQAAFWIDAMGGGRCYHGGEYRLHFHHLHNACHVMTQVGASRWMHHMRLALDESDLGPDPRVRNCIDDFLHARMEKYATDFGFDTGDRVYVSWNPDDWERTAEWDRRGPVLKCPVTGRTGACKGQETNLDDSHLQFIVDGLKAVQPATVDQSHCVNAAALTNDFVESRVAPQDVNVVDVTAAKPKLCCNLQ